MPRGIVDRIPLRVFNEIVLQGTFPTVKKLVFRDWTRKQDKYRTKYAWTRRYRRVRSPVSVAFGFIDTARKAIESGGKDLVRRANEDATDLGARVFALLRNQSR